MTACFGLRKALRPVVILTAVLVPTLLRGVEPPADLLRRSQQILAEEQRQHHVVQLLDGVVKHFRELVDDLESNGLLKDGQAKDVLQAATVLEAVGGQHVTKAREHLRLARKQLDDAGHLENADREIDIALSKLNELLKLAGSLEKNELVREQLRQIIRDQEKLNDATKDTGRQVLEGKLASPAAALKNLSATQQGVAGRVDKLPAALQEAMKSAEPDEQKQLEKAAEALRQKQVAGQLNAAARNIENKSVVEAVMQQKQALDALKEVLRMLEPSDPSRQLAEAQNLAEMLKKLEEAQRELRQNTEQQAAKAQSVQPLAPAQGDLAKQVANLPQAGQTPAMQKPLAQAQQAMQQAQQNLTQNQPGQAVPAQKMAEQALAEARKMAEAQQMQAQAAQQAQQMAQAAQNLMQQQQQLMNQTQQAAGQNLAPLSQPQNNLAQQAQQMGQQAMPQAGQPLQQAAKNMQAAAQALKQGQQGQALGQQKQALANLQKAAQTAQAPMAQAGQGMQPGQGMGMGQVMGMGMGMGMGAMAMAMNNQQGFNPQEGNRMFQKAAPVDGQVNRDRSTWTPLGMRERGALNEKFIRELPLEYRKLLKAYYEALAK